MDTSYITIAQYQNLEVDFVLCCVWLCSSMDHSPPGSSVHEGSLGKNTGVGCHALLQGIFPTQRLNPGLLHCKQILSCLSHQQSPWILEWVAYPFSRGSSQPRNQTRVSCIAGRFFTKWVTRKTHIHIYISGHAAQFAGSSLTRDWTFALSSETAVY